MKATNKLKVSYCSIIIIIIGSLFCRKMRYSIRKMDRRLIMRVDDDLRIRISVFVLSFIPVLARTYIVITNRKKNLTKISISYLAVLLLFISAFMIWSSWYLSNEGE